MWAKLRAWLGLNKKLQCRTARMARLSEQAGERYRMESRQSRGRVRDVSLANSIPYESVTSTSKTIPVSNTLLTEQNRMPARYNRQPGQVTPSARSDSTINWE